MSNHPRKKEMKAFKDYTPQDFTSHLSMTGYNRSATRATHSGLLRLVNPNAIDNNNVTLDLLTEEILNVPTVTLHR